jgi:hypothetical protein
MISWQHPTEYFLWKLYWAVLLYVQQNSPGIPEGGTSGGGAGGGADRIGSWLHVCVLGSMTCALLVLHCWLPLCGFHHMVLWGLYSVLQPASEAMLLSTLQAASAEAHS